jgi:hypothetical protein
MHQLSARILFDEAKPDHCKLAKLSVEAHRCVAAYIIATDLPNSLAKRRSMVREAVRETIDQIDALAAGMLA